MHRRSKSGWFHNSTFCFTDLMLYAHRPIPNHRHPLDSFFLHFLTLKWVSTGFSTHFDYFSSFSLFFRHFFRFFVPLFAFLAIFVVYSWFSIPIREIRVIRSSSAAPPAPLLRFSRAGHSAFHFAGPAQHFLWFSPGWFFGENLGCAGAGFGT